MDLTQIDLIDLTSWFGILKVWSILFAALYIYLTYIVPKQIENAKSQKRNESISDYQDVLSIVEKAGLKGLDPNLNETISKYPEWLDVEKLKKGQAFARKFYGVLNVVNYVSMIILLAHKKTTQTLITTKKQNTVQTSGKRWLSTIHHVRNWYDYDLLDFKSKAFKSIRIVSKYHLMASKLMNSKTNEEAEADTQTIIEKVGMIDNGYRQLIAKAIDKTEAGLEEVDWVKIDSGPHLNQSQIFATQWSFAGIVSSYPEKFGMKKDQDLDAFIYLWRYIGFLMGVEDEFNVCAGNYDRKFDAYLEYGFKPLFKKSETRWEHLVATMSSGLNEYLFLFPGPTVLCWLLDILEMNYVDFYNKLTFVEKMRLQFLKFMFKYQSFAPFRNFSNIYLRIVLTRFGKMMRAQGDKTLVL